MSELLPCPFCNKVVNLNNPDTLHPSGIFWREEDGIRVYVRHKERGPSDEAVWSMTCPTPAGGCGARGIEC